MEAQIRTLRKRLGTERIVPTPEERAELLLLGEACGYEVRNLIHIVTFRTWQNRLSQREEGGEHKRADIFPDPKKVRKCPPIPWRTFVHAHLESMIACDFLMKDVWTWRGRARAYVLVFIHPGSRRVYASASTLSPTHEWIMQQSRNVSMWLEDIGVEPRFLIRDGDMLYPKEKLADFWRGEGARVIRIPPKSPKANAFCEAFIGMLKRECLNHFVCLGLDHLDHIVRTWVNHYNTRRPHNGIGMNNEVLDRDFKVQTIGEVGCHEELGGIIKHYYRDAA